MRISLYAHGGSANHGCEALVRSTVLLTKKENDEFTLLSERLEEDFYYKLNEIVRIESSHDPLPQGLRGLIYKIQMKIKHDERIFYRNIYRNSIQKAGKTDLAIAIGGDNYCYKGFAERFGVIDDMFLSHGTPCILWGCSIDPYRIDDSLIKALKRYHFITSRESITYNALKAAGFKNLYLIPDTAFRLNSISDELSENFDFQNTIGINLSPLISGYEKKKGITLANYEYLIEFILHNTTCKIALIPHVVWSHNDDRLILSQLYDKFRGTDRIFMVQDCNAMRLKGYISRCRFLVAARTHASIAGYSTQVPTLVVGYSVKAVGIASDLFGTAKNYVLPVDLLSRKEELTEAFVWLMNNEDKIRNYYSQHISTYVSGLDLINELPIFNRVN